MEIIDNFEQSDVNLKNLKSGDTFKWNNYFFMKVSDRAYIPKTDQVACVNLKTGKVIFIHKDNIVQKVTIDGVVLYEDS